MDASVGNYLAGGGISGCVIAVSFLIYKMCVHRRFRSSCCGATVDLRDDNGQPSPDKEKQLELPPVIKTSH